MTICTQEQLWNNMYCLMLRLKNVSGASTPLWVLLPLTKKLNPQKMPNHGPSPLFAPNIGYHGQLSLTMFTYNAKVFKNIYQHQPQLALILCAKTFAIMGNCHIQCLLTTLNFFKIYTNTHRNQRSFFVPNCLTNSCC